MKKLWKILPLVMVGCIILTSVFAINQTFPTTNSKVQNVNTSVYKVWGTVTTIVQILAFAAIVFAGLRYMFSSADQKADIKRSLGILAIGAILVFAASTVVSFVVKAADEII